MEIKLIAMDLDGTALMADHCSFSPRLTAALDKAHQKGVMIAPVTGRQYKMLPPPLQAHPIWEDYAILCNGGQIRKMATGEVLESLSLNTQTLESLLLLSQQFDLPIEFSANSRLYFTKHSLETEQLDPSLSFHRDTILPTHGVMVDSLQPMCCDGNLPVEKVNLLCVPNALRATVEAELQRLSVSAVWSSENSIEITHSDATKGNALKKLCEILDIPTGCVMALGDSGNDVSMLKLAGLGVAMGNAPDYVKNAADVISESNAQDGAAHAIERYVLAAL